MFLHHDAVELLPGVTVTRQSILTIVERAAKQYATDLPDDNPAAPSFPWPTDTTVTGYVTYSLGGTSGPARILYLHEDEPERLKTWFISTKLAQLPTAAELTLNRLNALIESSGRTGY